uniref:LRR-RLK n=1 Tax=Rhizophora mucronata TaxID=61149 RepID=A0A2P2K2Z6_RHIMU
MQVANLVNNVFGPLACGYCLITLALQCLCDWK